MVDCLANVGILKIISVFFLLISRGCTIQQGCLLCNDTQVETTDHIMWSCPYARRFWQGLLGHYNISFLNGSRITEAWDLTQAYSTKRIRDRSNAVWAGGLWALWRERNRRVFSNNMKPVHTVLNDTILDITFWAAEN